MTADIEELKNEVLREIGRNVVLYQQFEVMLKLLVTHGKFSGYVCDLQGIQDKKKAKVMKQTLGQVAGQFLDNTLGEYQESNEELPELKEKGMHMSFSFQIQTDEDFYVKTRENIAKLVKERNDLIHHFPLNYNLNTLDGLKEAEQYLDSQRESLLPEYDNVKRYLKTLDQARKQFAEYISSGGMKRQWKLDELRQEYVVKLLGRIIEVAKRDDGWTLVVHAGQLLYQNSPDQLKEVKKKYKCRTLNDLILKTEIFDLEEESTPKGGKRTIYRLKDGWRLETHPIDEISN
ncbi:hypothetical protein [Desulfosediminicola ganghwensis]|uniref:hypothetical protein n=1 Tax=Desulfosediminicola ganghwensis TaxID=2569540 RepID=UPI0010ACA667|nr:hypothetical protein [Desulfosediminicola ganghwensis]